MRVPHPAKLVHILSDLARSRYIWPRKRRSQRGIAREIDDPGAEALLRRKYGWQKRVLDLLNGSPARGAWTTIEIAAS